MRIRLFSRRYFTRFIFLWWQVTDLNEDQKYLHGGNVYEAVKQQGGKTCEVIDFSANINPLGLSHNVRNLLLQSLDMVVHYPDPQAKVLKEAISTHYTVPYSSVTLGNGAVELLYILCHMVKPRKVLIPAPTFSEYERAACAAGAVAEYLYLKAEEDFQIDVQRLIKNTPGKDIIFICNPNNPTGTVLPNYELEPLLAAGRANDTIVVIDESFMDFMADDRPFSCRAFLTEYPNLVIIHSLTKFYAIPGLRLGFILTNGELQRVLDSGKDPWNVNVLAQIAGIAALEDSEYQYQSREYIAHAKNKLYNELNNLSGIKAYRPAVNYIFADIEGTGFSAPALREKLAMFNVLIRDCSNYHWLTPCYIRVAVRQEAQNEVLLRTLKRVL